MRQNLINIAFILEPEVDALIREWVEQERAKYDEEHKQNDAFYEEFVLKEKQMFDALYS